MNLSGDQLTSRTMLILDDLVADGITLDDQTVVLGAALAEALFQVKERLPDKLEGCKRAIVKELNRVLASDSPVSEQQINHEEDEE